MTTEDIEAAILAAGAGWDQPSQALVVAEKATPGYCNSLQCKSFLAGAIRSGSSAEAVGAAALAFVNGDKTLLLAVLAPPV